MVEVEPGVGIESAWDFLEVGVKAGTSVGVEDSIVFDNARGFLEEVGKKLGVEAGTLGATVAGFEDEIGTDVGIGC